MNPATILHLLIGLYEQLLAAQQRISELEELLVEADGAVKKKEEEGSVSVG